MRKLGLITLCEKNTDTPVEGMNTQVEDMQDFEEQKEETPLFIQNIEKKLDILKLKGKAREDYKEILIDEHNEALERERKKDEERELREQRKTENLIKLGSQIVAKDIQEGKPKTKKDGSIEVDSSGTTIYWDDKYSFTIGFLNGSMEIPVTKKQYDSFEKGDWISLEGSYMNVTSFGKSVLSPVFDSITKI